MLEKVWVRNAVLAGIFLAFIALLVLLSDVVGPILIALAAAYVFDPVIDQLERWKISRTLGIVIVVLILCLVMAGFALYIIPRLIHQVQELTQRLPGYLERLRELWPELKEYRVKYADEYEQAVAWIETQAKTHGGTLLKSLSASLASSFGHCAPNTHRPINTAIKEKVSPLLLGISRPLSPTAGGNRFLKHQTPWRFPHRPSL